MVCVSSATSPSHRYGIVAGNVDYSVDPAHVVMIVIGSTHHDVTIVDLHVVNDRSLDNSVELGGAHRS